MPSLVSPNISTNAFKSPVKTAITNPQSVNLTCLKHRENTQIVQIGDTTSNLSLSFTSINTPTEPPDT